MLVRFVVEPEAFLEETFGSDAATIRSSLGYLREFWSEHGILVQPSGEYEQDRWWDTHDKLADKARDEFFELFLDDPPPAEFRTVQSQHEMRFDDVETNAVLAEYAQQLDFDLALLQPARAVELGLPEDEFCACDHVTFIDRQAEITRWHLVNHTCKIRDLKELAGKDIAGSETPTDIWQHRIRDYAEYSHDLVIADPYATRDLEDDENPNEGLVTLLRFIFGLKREDNGRRRRLNITIFGTYDQSSTAKPQNSLANVRRILTDKINEMNSAQTRVSTVNVYLLSYPDNSGLFHDRWLRFNHNVLGLGQGLVVFNHKHSRRRRTSERDFFLKNRSGSDSSQGDEKALADACKGLNEKFSIKIPRR